MKTQITILLCAVAFGAATTTATEANAGAAGLTALTLEQALALAEQRQPELAAAQAAVEAAEGRVQQAGALPNPELVAGAQQLPLDRNASNQREYVAGVAQTVPLGGRLGKAREAEALEREVRARGLEVAHREMRKRVHQAFATALYQEQAFQIQDQAARLAARLVDLARARVTAGDAGPEELARAEMEAARAKAEARRSQSLDEQARRALAVAIGDASLDVQSLAGSLEAAFALPALEAVAADLSAQPEVRQAEAGRRASAARLDLAQAERIPDLKVEALYHRLAGPKENTFDLGVSVPLPLFNRGQGRVREARAEATAAEARIRQVRNEVSLRVHEASAQLTTALANARAFKAEVLPRADTVLKAAEARHAAGDIALAELLPVRRDRAGVQLAYLEALRDSMQAWAAVKAVAGP
jgi:cobalt-zinc-cadmium efflux system outer membrane protein